jgi:hypothetical protein
LTFTGRLFRAFTGRQYWTFTAFRCAWRSVHRVDVQRCTLTFTLDVHRGHDANKLGRVNQSLWGRTERALVDQFVERGAGDAKLACSLSFGERGHGTPYTRNTG